MQDLENNFMVSLSNRIICGDCVKVLGKVREPFADLIFADPPFNIGYQILKDYSINLVT